MRTKSAWHHQDKHVEDSSSAVVFMRCEDIRCEDMHDKNESDYSLTLKDPRGGGGGRAGGIVMTGKRLGGKGGKGGGGDAL